MKKFQIIQHTHKTIKEKCTKNKYNQILRHVWEKYKEMTNYYRHHSDVKEIYKLRPHVKVNIKLYKKCN